MRKAVIDFSSTALSLLVMEGTKPVFRLRQALSILDLISKKGKLSDRGIERVIDAASNLKETAVSMGADAVFFIATASMRLISNYEEVGEAIVKATGMALTILDGKEEAYCVAAVNREYADDAPALLLDLGGASAQLADLDEMDEENMYSLPIGSMSLYKRISDIYPDRKEAKELRGYVTDLLSLEMVYQGAAFERIVLAGSSAEALCRVYADYYRRDEGERTMERKKLRKLIDYLVSSPDRTQLLLRNAPDKVHVLIPSAILAFTVAKYFGSGQFIYTEKGVKEGYLMVLEE